MPEASHEDIVRRVAQVEQAQRDMHQAIARNREHSDMQIINLSDRVTRTHADLIAHRAEFVGLGQGLKLGLTGIAFLIATGLTTLGIVLS